MLTTAPTAACVQVLGRGVALTDQEFRDVDEVREGIHLVELTTVVVPLPAHLGAAANMCDRVDEAPIQQTQPVGIEGRQATVTVGAVAVLLQRTLAVHDGALAVNDRHWDLRPVARRGEAALGDIVGGIEIAEHGLAPD